MRSAFIECGAGRKLEDFHALLAGLDDDAVRSLSTDWMLWARDDQLPPNALPNGQPWRTWLILGGRGAGKTRAGAEWIRAQALGHAPLARAPARRIAILAETLHQARHVMIEGVSGLLAVHADDERPRYQSSKRELTWPNGAVAQVFSAEEPDALRGPQFAAAWVDELAKWRTPERAWDMLQFALRLGACPQVVVTTTPRSVPLLKAILADPATVTTRAGTIANAANLAPSFVAEMERRYAGTALLRQELYGELIDNPAGALWRHDYIETTRVARAPDLRSIVVAVDPPVTSGASADACGIIVAGLGEDGRAYVLADRTIEGREPQVWARAAIAAYHDFKADRIVAEVNQGGDLVVLVLKQIDDAVPVRKVRATRGKWLRAEPVSALYAEGRVAHVGRFDKLEEQMLGFAADGLFKGRSPDRLDALVWALTDLMLDKPSQPTIRQL